MNEPWERDVIEKTRHSRSLLGVEGLELLSSGVGTERGFTVTEVQDALAYVAAQPREGDPVADRTISYEHDNFGRVIKQIDPAVQTLSADGSIQMLLVWWAAASDRPNVRCS